MPALRILVMSLFLLVKAIRSSAQIQGRSGINVNGRRGLLEASVRAG